MVVGVILHEEARSANHSSRQDKTSVLVNCFWSATVQCHQIFGGNWSGMRAKAVCVLLYGSVLHGILLFACGCSV